MSSLTTNSKKDFSGNLAWTIWSDFINKFDSELSTVYQIIIRPLTDNDRKVELYRERDILFTVLKDGVKMNSNKGNSDNDEVESVKIGLAYAVFLKNEIMPQSILSKLLNYLGRLSRHCNYRHSAT